MSFDISSPVDITGDGPSIVNFVDQTNGFTWSNRTSIADTFQIGTDSIPNIAEIFPTGEVDANTFRLRGTSNKVSISVDPTVSTPYNIIFPPSAPTKGDTFVQNTTEGAWSNITPTNTVIVRKNPGPGQYSSVATAISSISGSPSDTNDGVFLSIQVCILKLLFPSPTMCTS